MADDKRVSYFPFTKADSAVDMVLNKSYINMRLCYTRRCMHLTQQDIATISGMSVSTVSRIDQGFDANIGNIIKYADACGYDLVLRKK